MKTYRLMEMGFGYYTKALIIALLSCIMAGSEFMVY